MRISISINTVVSCEKYRQNIISIATGNMYLFDGIRLSEYWSYETIDTVMVSTIEFYKRR